MSDNGVSFIVCTFNGAARITRVLGSLAKQVLPAGVEYEIVLVDNASTDDTGEVARQCWQALDKSVALHVVYEARSGLSFARAAGIKTARYEILSFIDDDNLIASDWCSRIVEKMRSNPKLGAIGGRGVAEFEGVVSPPHWFARYQRAYAVGPQIRERPARALVKLYGAGLTVRRLALQTLSARGFSPTLAGRVGTALGAGEDTELCYALSMAGWRLEYDHELVFRHVIPAKRLEKSYLLGLYRGFGRSSAALDLYRWMASRPSDAPPGRLAVVHCVRGLLITMLKTLFWMGWSLFSTLQDEETRLNTQLRNVYFASRFCEFLGSWTTAGERARVVFMLFAERAPSSGSAESKPIPCFDWGGRRWMTRRRR
jgi:glycosyltransferase involved in cell wall biosynthesis